MILLNVTNQEVLRPGGKFTHFALKYEVSFSVDPANMNPQAGTVRSFKSTNGTSVRSRLRMLISYVPAQSTDHRTRVGTQKTLENFIIRVNVVNMIYKALFTGKLSVAVTTGERFLSGVHRTDVMLEITLLVTLVGAQLTPMFFFFTGMLGG
jgi:hypothetical protein